MSRWRKKLWVAGVLVVLVTVAGASLGAVAAGLGQESTSTAPNAEASAVGYRDLPFSGAGGVVNPTGEKPQSKLWFNDGLWWGILFDRASEEYHIHSYDQSSHSWSDTGTPVDERNSSRADILWDGTHLYAASAEPASSDGAQGARLSRYGYDAATKRYSFDPGFPVEITGGPMEAVVLAKDTTGKLWATYTQDGKVHVTHTLEDETSWAEPFVPPVGSTAVDDDDISSIVAFDSKVGVMWSNQADGAFYFATHEDGDPEDAWQTEALRPGTTLRTSLQEPGLADDHISLKADSDGKVYAAVKTSLDDSQDSEQSTPLILLLVRETDGNWSEHVFGRKTDRHTRPMVLLDEEHRDLYVFATSPCCEGGEIYYKRTSMDDISFPEGKGTPFIKSAIDVSVDNATSTKQNLDGQSGLLVAASDKVTDYYLHNTIDLE